MTLPAVPVLWGFPSALMWGVPAALNALGPPLALSLFQHLLQGLLSSSGGDFPSSKPPEVCLWSQHYPSSHLYGARFGDSTGWHGDSPGGIHPRGATKEHCRMLEKQQKNPAAVMEKEDKQGKKHSFWLF